ncbi:MAG: aminotransferase class IV, partial [Nocardioides sp.]
LRLSAVHVWINGHVLPDPGAGIISAADHGFTVGDGVFEAIKVLRGVPFALTRHLERLSTSAAGIGLPAPDLDDVRRGVAAVLGAAPLELGRLRITYTGGPAPMGSGRGHSAPTLVVVADAMPAWPETTTIVTVPWPRNERGAVAGLKTTSYAENVVALAEAHRHGATEAIFANTVGNLCEGTGSNIFYVLDGELRTPTLASGCLAGVTRALVVDWCGAREIDEPIERVAAEASEVFLASTTRDVQGVRQWGERSFAAPGEITRACIEIWRRRESEDSDPR